MSNRQDPSDSFLINQYKSGKTSVLPILVKRYHKNFCEKAFWVTRNKESAKDIAQESWLTIINKLHTLKNVSSFKSWAFRIVYTKAIDAVRKISKENSHLKTKMPIDEEVGDEDYKRIRQNALRQAINNLPKQKQDIIRLFYNEEYSINEISAFLDIPVGTVKSRLFKAREKLKLTLKEMNYEK